MAQMAHFVSSVPVDSTPPGGYSFRKESIWLQRITTVLFFVMVLAAVVFVGDNLRRGADAQSQTKEDLDDVAAAVSEGQQVDRDVTIRLAALQCILLLPQEERTTAATNSCLEDAGVGG